MHRSASILNIVRRYYIFNSHPEYPCPLSRLSEYSLSTITLMEDPYCSRQCPFYPKNTVFAAAGNQTQIHPPGYCEKIPIQHVLDYFSDQFVNVFHQVRTAAMDARSAEAAIVTTHLKDYGERLLAESVHGIIFLLLINNAVPIPGAHCDYAWIGHGHFSEIHYSEEHLRHLEIPLPCKTSK